MSMFLVKQRPLVAIVNIMAAKKEVGGGSKKGDKVSLGRRLVTYGWVKQALDFYLGVYCSRPVNCELF